MKRPSDQAKLLFFALLRSSATALATTSEKAVPATRMVLPNIQLRLATRADVPSIQRCNLACLPENYNAQFYCAHLRQWPDLALVAEHVPDDHEEYMAADRRLRPWGSLGHRDGQRLHRFHNPEPKIVAYVLGKVETRRILDQTDPFRHEEETIGHVTSLAVQDDYRRQGIARALMKQLHFHLENFAGCEVGACGLHVRKSNMAARRLYENDGYMVDQVIPSYYQDGEDAFFMKKGLESSVFYGPGCYKYGPPELQLPRRHGFPDGFEGMAEEPELLTGTM